MDSKDRKEQPNVPFQEDNYTHNIRKDGERKLDRRSFMKMMAGAAGVFAVSTLPWGAIAARELTGLDKKTYAKAKIADTSAIKVGEAVEFAYPEKHDSALLVKLGDNEYKAYQNTCTHLKCPVFWSGEKGKLVCPCHHGLYDVQTGIPIAGPPQRPLPEITLETAEGAVYATGVKRYET
ncbi:MAG TPA: Rieske 2Fe-2S domain-containing protein [Paenibacillus sp.]|uniref:Rieske 2Fe-2S domain-containing protein n=1 Tax=Paenibacillus sp. TaxID=58172 RepID=UPI0028D070E2|nr:Rieske 2Fe-2S domain-containing protein [Paenibacillus sp.]HUC91679.1 Rieske 2Fe-2S domain-containing protein [Paenibacillus sp.]